MRITESQLRKIVREEARRLMEAAPPPGHEVLGTTPDGITLYLHVKEAPAGFFTALHADEAAVMGRMAKVYPSPNPGFAFVQTDAGLGPTPEASRADLRKQVAKHVGRESRKGDLRPSEARRVDLLTAALGML